MQFITKEELLIKLKNKEDIQLIDVREPWEHNAFNIGGELIPLGSLMENIDRVSKQKPVVFYCQKGIRSLLAIQRLQQRSGYENLVNLAGGIHSWNDSDLKNE